MNNTSFVIGNIAIIDKINEKYGLFDHIFDNLGTKAKNIKASAKLFVDNRLDKCLSVHQIPNFYPKEHLELLGFKEDISERTLYRNLTRIGERYQFLTSRYQEILQKFNLVSDNLFLDTSSSYFEGHNSELGKLGYSRDHRPGKLQLTFGVVVGDNNIPCALTIQKGNVQDKEHFKFMLDLSSKIIKENSLLIFDCGGNTKSNKKKVLDLNFNYLTLKAKKRKAYQKYISIFKNSEKKEIILNEIKYYAVKVNETEEVQYIYFSEKLANEQLSKREKKFKKEIKINDKKLSKVKKGKELGRLICSEGYIVEKGELQKQICTSENPHITGLEGYFILESSVNLDSKKILEIYKDKDKVEKLIRNMKEGTEIRPMRHWDTNALIGYLFIIFLTNSIINLTQKLNNNVVLKNLKLLKKTINNLTLTFVYPENGFRFKILSNISEEILLFFGDFIYKYQDKSLKMRW